MIKKFVLIALLLIALTSKCFAGFEYSGSFAIGDTESAHQSYYILLNEGNRVVFDLKDDSGNLCKEVLVSRIRFSSNELDVKTSSGEIKEFVVPATGIYEVEVSLKNKIDSDLLYTLLVVETEDSKKASNEETESARLNDELEVPNLPLGSGNEVSNKKPEPESSKALANSSSEEVENTENLSPTVIGEALGADSVAIEGNTELSADEFSAEGNKNKVGSYSDLVGGLEQISKNVEVTEATNNEKEFQEAVAVEAPAEVKKLNYDGKIELVKSFEAFDFLAERNKSWVNSLVYDNRGNLWILDGQLNRVSCFDSNGSKIKSFDLIGKDSALGIPITMTVFKENLLIGDRKNHSVLVFDLEGNLINSITSDRALGLEITNPISIMTRNNEVWVADAGSNRVLCFDDKYKFLGSFGSTDESKIESIAGASTDGQSIYILEEEGNIKKFGPMGNFESAFSTGITFSSQLFIDSSNNLWVVDSDNGSLACFSKEGTLILNIDIRSLSNIDESLKSFSPVAISIATNGLIAVSDVSAKQIRIFDLK